jgi:hypothetical protein
MIGRWHWSVWLKGLIAALISGASTSIAAAFAIPEAVSTAHPAVMVKMAIIGSVVGLASYLKSSPLPPEDPPTDDKKPE